MGSPSTGVTGEGMGPVEWTFGYRVSRASDPEGSPRPLPGVLCTLFVLCVCGGFEGEGSRVVCAVCRGCQCALSSHVPGAVTTALSCL